MVALVDKYGLLKDDLYINQKDSPYTEYLKFLEN